MSRSPASGVLLFVISLIIASEVLSAPSESLISQKQSDKQFVETRETEFLEARAERLMRNERFDVSREDELLHRLARVVKEPPEVEKNSTAKISDNKDGNSKSNPAVSETKDLNGPHVTPADEDDVKTSTIIPVTIKPANATTDAKSLVPPTILPNDAGIKAKKDASKEMIDKLNKTNYEIDGANVTESSKKTNETIVKPFDVVDATETSKSPSTTLASLPVTVQTTAAPKTTAAPPAANSTVAPVSTTVKPTESTTKMWTRPSTTETTKPKWPLPDVPTTTDEPLIPVSYTTTTPEPPGTSTLSYAELKLHEKKRPEPNTAMPSGIVALITALAFCILAVVIYTGLFVRRRYTEWRYGNRELLVNEFDSTDVSHFEL